MYDIFVIGNNNNWKKIKSKYPFAKKVNDFKEAKAKAITPMFWAVWDDINVDENFDFTFSVPKWDEEYIHVWKNKEYFDGLSLVPKHKTISDKELKYRFFTDKKEVNTVASDPRQYDIFQIETYEQYLNAMEKSTTDMFWMTSANLKIADDFKFDLYITHHNAYERQENHAFVHLVGDQKLYNGVFLLSKHKPVTKKEIEHRHIVERKEWDIVASGPCEYDKFIVDTYEQYLEALAKSTTEMVWIIPKDIEVLDDFKFDLYFEHYNVYDRNTTHIFRNSEFYDGIILTPKNKPISQKEFDAGFVVDKKEYDVMASVPKKFDKFDISTYEQYLDACEKSTTGMFWAIWSDVEVVDDFDFDYYVPRYNRHIVHIFKNGQYFDGICLFSKTHKVSEKEFQYRFFTDKKEIDYVVSYPKKNDIFVIDTYDQYLEAMQTSRTDMFWMTSANLKIDDNFTFDIQCSRYENHAFVHLVNDEKLYNGVYLLSKFKPVTEKEIKHRYIIDRKEWNVIASGPCEYDKFIVETYDQYLEAMQQSRTEMFWALTHNVKIDDDFKFDVYFSQDKIYDRAENHVFIHKVGDDQLYNGIFLLSKNKPLTAKEIDHRHIVERKEWPIVASGPCEYDKFIVDTYDDYLLALSNSKTEMFWMIPSDVEVLDDFKFDLYFEHSNVYDRNMTHIFRNSEFYDGIMLTPKNKEWFTESKHISRKEFDYGFIVDRKEYDVLASVPKKFDKFHISTYQEYQQACEQSTTGMFWAIWSDVEVVDDFDFDYYVPRYNRHVVHVFKNGQLYDGVCLFSANHKVSEREFNYRYFTDKKEIDYVVSYPKKYDIFEIYTYDDYLAALKNSTTDQFWMTSANLKIDSSFDLTQQFTRYENHAFVHLVNDEKLYNGIFLLSRHKPVTAKEIEHRHLIEHKEWDIIASGPCKYDSFNIESFEDYENAVKNSKTEMFWALTPNVKIADDFAFDIYFSHDKIYDRVENHVFIHRVDEKDLYNGIFLLSKHKPISKKEIEHRYIVERKEWPIVASGPCEYDKFIVDTYEQYLEAIEKSKTEMLWIIPSDVEVLDDFRFDLYFEHSNLFDRNITHIFRNSEFYDGIMLTPKSRTWYTNSKIISKKEFDYGFIVDRKEYDIMASVPKKFEKFYISNYQDYLNACEKSSSNMFWAIWSDVEVVDDFDFDYYVPRYNRHIVHVFKNDQYYDGVCLFSKHHPVTEKECNYRFFTEKKEIDYVVSYPKKYDIFEIDTYDQYLEAMEKSTTNMFWMTSATLKIVDNFDFSLYISHHNVYERKENHAFIHLVKDEKLYNGVFLLSKNKPVTEKEIEFRHIIERKEWDMIVSEPCVYDIFEIETYDQYLEALEKSKTEMFWMSSANLKIAEDFKFDIYFDHSQIYERKENHAFIHQVDGEELYNGVFLLSKHKPISEKEVTFRYLINRKEWPIVASGPCEYDKFVVNTYDDYIHAMKSSRTEMFWMIPKEVEILDTFNFDVYFQHHNTYDRQINHSFKHLFRNEETFNGVCLMSKHAPVSEKEITFRYLVDRKEWNTVASKMKPYDIIFISYNEMNADENYNKLSSRFDRVKRVHGVKGIHQAHIQAAKISDTENFWVVDGDAEIMDDFNFDYEIPVWEQDTVHVWRSKNPINDLVYGYGGVKLLPRQLTIDMDVTRPDMTTSISKNFKPVQVVSNITAFNTDEFSTWKSAFRECAKLSGRTIDRQVDAETEERLNVWCSQGGDKLYGEYAIKGALAGRKFATEFPEELFKINDFEWLYQQYEKDCNQ